MNYNYTTQMESFRQTGESISTCNVTMIWRNAEFQESGQSFVLSKFYTLTAMADLNLLYLRDMGETLKEYNGQMVETYSKKENNGGTYLKVTATAKRIASTSYPPEFVTFSIDNQLSNDDGWCDAIWSRLSSILGAGAQVNMNNYRIINLILELHD